MKDEQIKEVMRLADDIADYAWKQGLSDGAYSQSDHDRKSCDASRAELETYLRTIGEPENTLPLNPNGSSKWAHLQKHNGAEAVGVVFRTGTGSVGSLVDGRVVWADWLAHPTGSKPAGDDLRWAAGVIEKYDDATIEACYMIDSTDCAAILTALAEYRERFDSPTTKHSEPESMNAELLEALKAILADGLHCDVVPHLHRRAAEAIARAESAIETPAKASPASAPPLPHHVFRELVNDLRDLAKQFHGHESLRERISGRLAQDVPVVGPCSGHAAQQEAAESCAHRFVRDEEAPRHLSCQVCGEVKNEADEARACETCGGRGEVGGFVGGGAPGYETHPCPDCRSGKASLGGLQFKCWRCLDTGFIPKAASLPEPPDVKCPNGCLPKKGGA